MLAGKVLIFPVLIFLFPLSVLSCAWKENWGFQEELSILVSALRDNWFLAAFEADDKRCSGGLARILKVGVFEGGVARSTFCSRVATGCLSSSPESSVPFCETRLLLDRGIQLGVNGSE